MANWRRAAYNFLILTTLYLAVGCGESKKPTPPENTGDLQPPAIELPAGNPEGAPSDSPEGTGAPNG